MMKAKFFPICLQLETVKTVNENKAIRHVACLGLRVKRGVGLLSRDKNSASFKKRIFEFLKLSIYEY